MAATRRYETKWWKSTWEVRLESRLLRSNDHAAEMLYVATAQPATAQLGALSCDFLEAGVPALVVK